MLMSGFGCRQVGRIGGRPAAPGQAAYVGLVPVSPIISLMGDAWLDERGRPLSARVTSAAQQRSARTAARRPMTGRAHPAQPPAALAAGSPAA